MSHLTLDDASMVTDAINFDSASRQNAIWDQFRWRTPLERIEWLRDRAIEGAFDLDRVGDLVDHDTLETLRRSIAGSSGTHDALTGSAENAIAQALGVRDIRDVLRVPLDLRLTRAAIERLYEREDALAALLRDA